MAATRKRRVIVDSDVVFELLNGTTRVHEELKLIGSENVCVSVVSVAECSNSFRKDRQEKARRYFSEVTILDFDVQISKRFKGLALSYSPRTRWIPDALIAATAIEHGLPLFTLNRKDFEFIEELELYQPRGFIPNLPK
jgi:predicted nucleic acid-binding protein